MEIINRVKNSHKLNWGKIEKYIVIAISPRIISIIFLDKFSLASLQVAEICLIASMPVSYTHLDVYKRQDNVYLPLADGICMVMADGFSL